MSSAHRWTDDRDVPLPQDAPAADAPIPLLCGPLDDERHESARDINARVERELANADHADWPIYLDGIDDSDESPFSEDDTEEDAFAAFEEWVDPLVSDADDDERRSEREAGRDPHAAGENANLRPLADDPWRGGDV